MHTHHYSISKLKSSTYSTDTTYSSTNINSTICNTNNIMPTTRLQSWFPQQLNKTRTTTETLNNLNANSNDHQYEIGRSTTRTTLLYQTRLRNDKQPGYSNVPNAVFGNQMARLSFTFFNICRHCNTHNRKCITTRSLPMTVYDTYH